MLIIDGHEDLAWSALMLQRDISRPLSEIRAAEGPSPEHGEGAATVSLPELRRAGVRIVLASLFAMPFSDTPLGHQGYRSPDEAYRQAADQLDFYLNLEERGEITIIRHASDIHRILQGECPLPGIVLLMEGAEPVRSLDDLGHFVTGGLRFVGLSWHATRYAGGTGEPGPLTASGRELLQEMGRLGLALDISHLAEAAFWEALDIFPGQVIASHANCRAIIQTDRQLSDAMIEAIAARDGVIGLLLYNRFLSPSWKDGDAKDKVSLQDFLRQVNRIKYLVGTSHLGLGTDLDGGVSREAIPGEIDSAADLPKIAVALKQSGYSDESIADIMGKNWLRVIERCFESSF